MEHFYLNRAIIKRLTVEIPSISDCCPKSFELTGVFSVNPADGCLGAIATAEVPSAPVQCSWLKLRLKLPSATEQCLSSMLRLRLLYAPTQHWRSMLRLKLSSAPAQSCAGASHVSAEVQRRRLLIRTTLSVHRFENKKEKLAYNFFKAKNKQNEPQNRF
jgi:hypothetical protein